MAQTLADTCDKLRWRELPYGRTGLTSPIFHPSPQICIRLQRTIQLIANPAINTTVARSAAEPAPLVQIDAIPLVTARADPIIAAVSNGDGTEAGAVLDVAGGFDADGTAGSGLESFGFFGDGEGGGADAEEREACESGEGEHGVCLGGKQSVRSCGLMQLSRGGVL